MRIGISQTARTNSQDTPKSSGPLVGWLLFRRDFSTMHSIVGTIVIYTHFYAPELTGVGRYAGELAAELSARGHSVEVIAPPPHYPGWYVREPYSPIKYKRENLRGVTVWRCPIYIIKNGQGLGRFLAPISFAIASAPVAFWRIIRGRPDVVLCVEPTLAVAPLALLVAFFTRSRTILHVQDLEVDAAIAVGHVRLPGPIRKAVFSVERFLLARFESVVTISRSMAFKLREKGVGSDRLSIIRNWVDTTKIRPMASANPYRQELGIGSDQYVVLYSGQIGPKQALHFILEAAALLVTEPKIKFIIAGEGPSKPDLIRRFGQAINICFLPLQPEARLSEFLNLADCHILTQNPEVNDLVLPSKVGGMLASGRQILVAADSDSELASFLEGCAMIVPPGKPSAIADGLKALRQTPDESAHIRLERADSIAVGKAMDRFEDLFFPAIKEKL